MHARADIEAKVWYSKSKTEALTQIQKRQTGDKGQKYAIKFHNFRINFYKTLSKFQNYDTIVTNKKLKLFSNFYLPIEFIMVETSETEETVKEYETEELKEKLKQELEQELKQEIELEERIVNEQINSYETEDTVTVEVIYEVLDNVGAKEKIVY